MAEATRRHLALWALRLLLAALFVFGGEVLVWTEMQTLTLPEVLLRGAGYIALAVLVLDLAARYRIRDLYDSMALLCVYGLAAGLLLTPELAFADFPRTFVTRVLGSHNLTGAIAFGLFLALTAGHVRQYRWRCAGVLAWTGFYRGVWLRWNPVFNPEAQVISLPALLALAGGVLLPALLLLALAYYSRATTLKPLDLRLPFIGVMVVLLVLLLLFLARAVQGVIDGGGWLLSLLLIGVCLAVLWFRRSDHSGELLDAHLPPTPPALPWLLVLALIFILSLFFGYALPLAGTPDYNQFWLMELGYSAVGFLWLPLLAGVIAVRGVDRQMRTRTLDIL
ncbi:MAG: hypothetical protein MUE40_17035 [Anaerolineae bacterium]|nr:hypothetical protein [Anaerolineae bacterium]